MFVVWFLSSWGFVYRLRRLDNLSEIQYGEKKKCSISVVVIIFDSYKYSKEISCMKKTWKNMSDVGRPNTEYHQSKAVTIFFAWYAYAAGWNWGTTHYNSTICRGWDLLQQLMINWFSTLGRSKKIVLESSRAGTFVCHGKISLFWPGCRISYRSHISLFFVLCVSICFSVHFSIKNSFSKICNYTTTDHRKGNTRHQPLQQTNTVAINLPSSPTLLVRVLNSWVRLLVQDPALYTQLGGSCGKQRASLGDVVFFPLFITVSKLLLF